MPETPVESSHPPHGQKNLGNIPRPGQLQQHDSKAMKKKKESTVAEELEKVWKWHYPSGPTTAAGIFKETYGGKAKIRKRKTKSDTHRRRMNRGCSAHHYSNPLIIVTALREIQFYQRQPGIFIPRAGMQRLVKKMVSEETMGRATRLSREAYAAIHLATEQYLTTWFELVYVNFDLLC